MTGRARGGGKLRDSLVVLILAALLGSPALLGARSYWLFESGPVRPLAMSPDGTRLFACNIPDNRLEVFDTAPTGLTHVASIPVGMEPVAVAPRSNDEVWVVNHLSDSVSVVDLTTRTVVRTLHVGDEPTDIVFAGASGELAFIAAAHRGQNTPEPRGEYWEDGIGRLDVWVFDANNLGDGLGGDELAILTLFADRPRALAASADGSRVYAAAFLSGNRTTTVSRELVCDGGVLAAPCEESIGTSSPGGLPAPNDNAELVAGPETGLIVSFDEDLGQWTDELGRDWSDAVHFDLPDADLFEIDATTLPPTVLGSWSDLGTVIFNLAIHPVSGAIYATTSRANNRTRFEGLGVYTAGQKSAGEELSLRGHQHEAHIAVIDSAGVSSRHLNKHIVYDPAGALFSEGHSKADTVSAPLDMALSSDGGTLYVAAFGTNEVAVYDTAELEADSFVPSSTRQIPIPGGGPAGLALDEEPDPVDSRLYVLARFSNAIVTIDTFLGQVSGVDPLHSPEPASVSDGRPFLYDADLSSANGEASCASCHVFGDVDGIAWDLGDPDGFVVANDNPVETGTPPDFHPLKGPMMTQTLRGMDHHGPLHWRGDRTAATALDPDGAFNERTNFTRFNGAFASLLGKETPLPGPDAQAFADFALQLVLPPNPIRQLDNSLRSATPRDELNGENIYFERMGCDRCHPVDLAQGLIGTNGLSQPNRGQSFKIPHLRNLYTKVGMFGLPELAGMNAGDNGHQGDQIRGYGFTHDGAEDTIFRHMTRTQFNSIDFIAGGDAGREDVEAYLMVFPNTLAPIVGQQVTLTDTNSAVADPRIDLMIQRAQQDFPLVDEPGARECELIAKGVVGGVSRGWLMQSAAPFDFAPDSGTETPIADAALRQLAATTPLTYTCVPPGAGARMGIDRDEDGSLDFDDGCPSYPQASSLDSSGDGVPDECQCGDGNTDGHLNALDIGIAAQCANGVVPCEATLVDANGDGVVNALDIGAIAQVSNGVLQPFQLRCARRREGTPPN